MKDQRLTDRLTQYWELIRQSDPYPPLERFNHTAVNDLWSNCMLFAVNSRTGITRSYTYYRMGDRIQALYGHDMSGQSLSPTQRMFKGAEVVKRLDEVFANPKPIYDNGQFVTAPGGVVKFRSCLLPFGKAGTITHIIAGISWREF